MGVLKYVTSMGVGISMRFDKIMGTSLLQRGVRDQDKEERVELYARNEIMCSIPGENLLLR